MKLYTFPGFGRDINRAEVIDMIETKTITPNAAIHDAGAPPSSVCAVKDHVDFKGTVDFDAAVAKASAPTTTTAPPIRTATPTPTPTPLTPAAPARDWNPLAIIAAVLLGIVAVWALITVIGSPKLGWGKGIDERVSALENRPVSVADPAIKKAIDDANARAAAADTKATAAIAQGRDMANANLCPNGSLDACVASLKAQGVAEKFGKEACAPTCLN